MTIYPAIDIYEGKAVRLRRGEYTQMTVYSDDPVSVAHSFKEAAAAAGGADMSLHVVDLEGARDGKPANHEIITKIAAAAGIPVQAGGGIRTKESIEMYINAGVSRVILGTAAVAQPGFLREAVSAYGEAIAVSADIKDGLIAVRGWTEVSDRDVLSFCAAVGEIGVKTIICTDISRDGMQGGSNVDLYRTLSRSLKGHGEPVSIIASGGVSALDEIEALASAGVSGVILGKALYEGSVRLEDVLLFAKRYAK